MKRLFIAILVLLTPAAVMAQEERVQTTGSATLGVQQVDIDTNSAKFNEYRDIRDGFYLYDLNFEALDTETGLFLVFRGKNLIRDDQTLNLDIGSYGAWRLEIERNEIPHRLSNKAKTPYINQGGGLFTVPSQVGIIDDGNDATGTPSLVPTAGQMAVNDQLVEAYLPGVLRSVELGTQRKRDSAALSISPLDFLKFRLTYSDERKDGSKITFGPIGDRPPRTLNIEFTEPVDYRTRELLAEVDVDFDRFQGRFAYKLSDFENETDTLTWENIFFTPDAGDDFITTVAGTPRNVSSFGQRSLAPDNRYHNVSGSFGVDLPMASRLAATAAYGWWKQDENLLPYSVSSLGSDWNALDRLPRTKADAEINTTLFNLDYLITPVDRLKLRAFYRYYDLDNETGTAQWEYATQDTVNTDGSVNYRNFRRNLAFAYTKQNFGLDAAYSLDFWRTTLGLGYEREEIDRDFREADTDEDIFTASVRTRPTDWITLRMKYLYGDREADDYNFRVTSQSYWYDFAVAANEVDNPQFLFANHPDLRKFDVSDRERNQFDISAMVTPIQALDLSASYGYRKDDFDSNVGPVQPLLGTTVPIPNPADEFAATPGLQLGLLEEKRQNYTLDAFYTPTDRLTLSAFGSRETIDSDIRGMVYNENQRREPSNPGIQDERQLGPWTDPSRLYEAKIEDRTNTVGVGAGYAVVPGKWNFATDFTLSRGKVDLDYSGYGTQFEDEFQFAFSSPKTVRHNQYILNATLEYQVFEGMVVGLHYLFDKYKIRDWMQDPTGPWVEEAGSEYFLRDTSRDNRWGNRLVNMGSTLSPSYEAHVGYLTMTYKF